MGLGTVKFENREFSVAYVRAFCYCDCTNAKVESRGLSINYYNYRSL